MSDVSEVLITSDASSTVWSCCVWDYNTGTALHTYRGGGVPAPNTISFINNDYLITAERLKPILHVWPLNSQETVKNTRFVCPGKVTTLSITPDGCYCCAGIDDKLYVWQIATGRLLAIGSKHFQPITKLAISGDGTHVVTAGEDGLVILWSLVLLMSLQPDETEPLWILSEHSMPVTDMYLGKNGLDSHLTTVSSDRTLKLYHLISGTLLLSAVFESCLTAVTMNSTESSLYVGNVNGFIYELNLVNPPRTREYHVPESKTPIFKSHSKSITCLTVSMDGRVLASGSQDEQIIIWHIETKQKLRSIPHKSAITNVLFKIPNLNMFSMDFKPVTVLNSFQRGLESNEDNEIVEVIHSVDLNLPFGSDSQIEQKQVSQTNSNELLKEIEKLKAINTELYQFSLDKIIHNTNVVFENGNNETVVKRKRKLELNK